MGHGSKCRNRQFNAIAFLGEINEKYMCKEFDSDPLHDSPSVHVISVGERGNEPNTRMR